MTRLDWGEQCAVPNLESGSWRMKRDGDGRQNLKTGGKGNDAKKHARRRVWEMRGDGFCQETT